MVTSRASTVVPFPISLPPPPPPSTAAAPIHADNKIQTQLASVATAPKLESLPRDDIEKQVTLQEVSPMAVFTPHPREKELKTAVIPLLPLERRTNSIDHLASNRAYDKVRIMQPPESADDASTASLPEVFATENESMVSTPPPAEQVPATASEDESPPKPIVLASDKVGARKTASNLLTKRVRGLKHSHARQPPSETTGFSDSEKDLLPQVRGLTQ